MTNAPHAITRLTLENFRNYRTLTLDLPPKPVVLVGHNGAGKTNILEAISLFAPGRGMRGAKLRAMDLLAGEGAPWVVAAQVTSRGIVSQIGTGRDSESMREKRRIKIDGVNIRGQATLTKAVCVQWLTPSMDQVFVEGGAARRDLLDRIVYGFDPEHAARVTAYGQAMRERNRLLADGGNHADTAWLTVLERQMAEHGIAMTLARLEAIGRVTTTMQDEIAGFPTAIIHLEGNVETALAEGASALEAEEFLTNRLAMARPLDVRSGRCSEGVHRSHLKVIHNIKSMEVEHCSTGEQKAMLLSLILAAARSRAQWVGMPPILLLDEVIAHLDVDKR
ncbi:MAG: DNA replication/repair protein RecF, partial [Rhodospirillales bacterium 12-54-5]